MIITIESKAKPCPGVRRAIALTEEVLKRGEEVFSIGQLIHNRREVERLQKMGLQIQESDLFADLLNRHDPNGGYFLVRTHGESEEILRKVHDKGFRMLDTTCPIVGHSQKIVDEHVRGGWHIVIAGNREHPEVKGLLTRTQGLGRVISSRQEAENQDFQEHTLLLAQTTVDPVLFSEVTHVLSKKRLGLKIMDTTCQFLHHRQNDIRTFGSQQDIVLIIGGKQSANCQLLYRTVKEVNPRVFKIEGPEEIDLEWFQDDDSVGISGGASTPRWQLDEVKKYLKRPL
ncbi:4-hydroxy-3-methylbut-2-enyl diphosphate reductase [bacterium]|nr:4-hydroxy-3-methylbut-2-enyl diphosphate reductase [bacterium]RQV95266.1 MAG: 4-hydroxy-3-methylbut-2-enyl diphosphate reductase [bacterium]